MNFNELPQEIPIGRAKNLIGQKFGKLTVLYRTEGKDKKRVYFACKCDCGEYTVVRADHLKDPKHTNSCGCLDHPNLTGQIFGKLLVIQRCNEKGSGAKWECQCECGKKAFVITRDLLSGHTRSCGCIRSQGELIITKILQQNNIPFESEKNFQTAQFKETNHKMSFDFYINNSFLLEFDGEQHYPVNKNHGWMTKERYEINHKHDLQKNEWCKQNNIPLKRIPYWDKDKITIESILDNTYLVN